jgi:outer membrane receptor for ferrienterochelin and colicin
MRKSIQVGLAVGLCALATSNSYAAIFGTVTGTVEDPQHQPVAQVRVTIRAPTSGWQDATDTDGQGRFVLQAVPTGNYVITAAKQGFRTIEKAILVRSGTVTVIGFALPLGAITETLDVVSNEGTVNTKSSTTGSLVARDDIERTPGALRTNSMDLVTQYVPGSYMIHDQLHIRGGHQVSWLVDGVPVPNTNIASNVGPQFDPKDIETIDIQRGGYSAEFGERAYGIFNVVPRSGFERSREAEALVSYGSLHETNDQFSLGDHNDRFAYYVSANVNYSELGLETPVPETLHDNAVGVGGFGSLIYKSTSTDQVRLVASLREDHYRVPNTPEGQAAGIDDLERERDAFINLSWLHTVGSKAFLTVSPFYHYNRAAFDGGAADPIVTTAHRTSNYVGGQAVLAIARGSHTARVGGYGFFQHDVMLFGLQSSDEGTLLSQEQAPNGHVEVAFAEDQYAVTDRITLNGGVRVTHFSGATSETAVGPRLGVAFRVPRVEWAARASYGRYYQPPPLLSVAGPLLDVAAQEGFGFLPLQGERDDQYEIGVAIPLRGWAIDTDYFRTNARNFFDHDAIGNSNIFIPLTIDRARIRGFEATLRSPRRRPLQAHVAYSHQFVEGRGGITGGLTDFAPPSDDYFFLDHDQRDTLTGGMELEFPRNVWTAISLSFGSGFLEGDGPEHKPAHAEFNVQAGKSFGRQWTLMASVLNVGNSRYLLDESNTFGGTHYNSPRQVSVGMRYRFHY